MTTVSNPRPLYIKNILLTQFSFIIRGVNSIEEKQPNAGKESLAMNFTQKNRLFHVLRYVLLFGFLAFLTFELSMHVLGDKTYPNVHALCPFGGLESLLSFLAMDGTFLKKIFSGTMGIFFVFLILTLIFNRAFCGLLCPFGALQELFGNLGKRFLKVRPVMPADADRIARYFKYMVLFLAVVMAWWTGTLWYQTFDPWTAYAHLANPAEALASYGIGIAFLLISIAGSFFYERFYPNRRKYRAVIRGAAKESNCGFICQIDQFM